MKKLSIVIVVALLSSNSWAALLAPAKDVRNSSSQLEVLPPMGFLDCEECQNPYMGGIKGPSKADLELWRNWERDIFGGGDNQNNSAGSIEDEN